MSFLDKLQNKIPTLSYEFFPPKTEKGLIHFKHVIKEVSKQQPNFISITYGAGGTEKNQTLNLVQETHETYDFDCVPHLTGVSHTPKEINEILDFYQKNNLEYILALRGDLPQNYQKNISLNSSFFPYASDLISYIDKQHNYSFQLGCACYPEVHTEAISPQLDLDYLKRKQDLGAKFAITQLFFNNEDFFQFQNRAIQTGINIPIIAGIMPVTAIEQLKKFANFGTKINDDLKKILLKSSDVEKSGIEWISNQCLELLQNNVAGLHFYTLNRFEPSIKITQKIKQQGYFL